MQVNNISNTLVNPLLLSGEEVWLEVIEQLKSEYGLAAYNSWFAQMQFVELKNEVIRISVPTRFIRESIINNYFNKIKQVLGVISPGIKIIDLRVSTNRITTDNCVTEQSPSNDNGGIETQIEQKNYSDQITKLNPKFRFDNFIVAPSNRFALAAAKAIIESKNNTNVLFIHSSVGLGKTHLLQAATNHIFENPSGLKAMYISAEKFMHNYIASVRNNNSIGFKEQFHNLDILLIDDLQFICGKNGTLSAFANTFNMLIESGKTIVISADRSPYLLELDQRTKSRLTGGLVVEIKPAEHELRVNILKMLRAIHNVVLDDEVVEFLAKSITSSIRELEGAFNNLLHHSQFIGIDISMESAKEILRNSLLANEMKISIKKIIDSVANYYGIKANDIISKSRSAKFVLPRQITMFIAKQLTDKSLKEIGDLMGKRDHATVIYSVKKIEEIIERNPETKSAVTKISELLEPSSSF